VRNNLKPSTYRGYRVLLEKHILPEFGNKPLPEITRDEIKALCYRKLEGGLSGNTVSYIARTLSAIFNHAVEDGILSVNHAQRPGRYIRKGNRIDKIDFLSPEEGHLLLDSAEEHYPRFYPILLTALRTGARQGELIGLQWGDIDWNGKFIEIRRSNWNGYISTPKNGKGRRVDMSDRLAAVLADHRRKMAADVLGNGRSIPVWVFPSLMGTALDAANVRKIFEACLKKSGLRKIRFHDLRHSFASWLIANGESLVYVKEQLGHHSIQITVDTYGHLIPGANRQAVNRLDDPMIGAQRFNHGEPSVSIGS
jgi:integrase